jgi:hypothetical protein
MKWIASFRMGRWALVLSIFSVSLIEARVLDEGLWPPFQIDKKKERLQELGLEIDPANLSNPLIEPLNAVIQLGNPQHSCSASFVSSDGLVITNHHCVEDFVAHNSTADQDLGKLGFLARTREEEPQASPTARLYITRSFKDITDQILAGVDETPDATERFKKIQDRQKQARDRCDAEVKEQNMECEISSFFEGAQFFEIRKFVIRDVRLVYVPEKQIGFYGGFEDNWRWPRQTGDFAFLRAYVSKEGKSEAFSKDNIPYKPESFLKIAKKPLEAGEIALVTGYPGRTNSLSTADEAQEAADWLFPWISDHFKGLIAVMESATAGRPDERIKIQPTMFSLTNSMQYREGSYPNMIRSRLIGDKVQIESEINLWLREVDPKGVKYGNVIERLQALQAQRTETRVKDRFFSEFTRDLFSSALIGTARSIVKKTSPGATFSLTDREAMAKTLESFYANYDAILDRAKLEYQLGRLDRLADQDQPQFGPILRKWADAAGSSVTEWLYDGSLLSQQDIALEFVRKASLNQIRNDPMIRLAIAIEREAKEVDARAAAYNGEMAVLRPLYVRALRDYTQKTLFPDANSTLRVSFGRVMGYAISDKGINYTPFTTVADMLSRHREGGVFEIPERLRRLGKAKNFGTYEMLPGELPVNFLTDCHITGGNSGSATLNGRGELIGLAFDSNYEGLGSDWRFLPEATRSIHVDIRYVLWVMDYVDGAHHLLSEMGIKAQSNR